MILYIHSGLASRCRCLSDAYYLVKKYEKKPRLIILWLVESCCDIKYEEVFDKKQFSDIKLKVVTIFESKGLKKALLQGKLLTFAKELLQRIKVFLMMAPFGKRKYIDYDDMKLDLDDEAHKKYHYECWKRLESFLEERSGEAIVRDYQALIVPRTNGNERSQNLIFLCGYNLRADEILSHLGENVIGIHIRRTDHIVAIEKSPVDRFVSVIEKELAEDENCKVFLATDDHKTENEIVIRFGKDRIQTLPNKDFSTQKRGMMDAVADMLVLSKCRKIYGSYATQFSGFAAEYGNIPLEVVKKLEE